MRVLAAAAACALSLVMIAPAQARPLAGVIRDLPARGAATALGEHPAIDRASRAHVARLAFAASPTLPYGGGPVLHSNRTHVIFWQPSGSGLTFDPDYQSQVVRFLRNVASASRSPTNVYGLTGQYRDAGGPAAYASSYGGAVAATDPLPPNGCEEPRATGPGWTVCLTDAQLQREIEHVVRVEGLPTGPTDVYFLLTPNGLGDCADSSSSSCALGGDAGGYCAYHQQTNDGKVFYAVIPYNAVPSHCQSNNPRPNGSTADPTLSTISHEHSEMVTDPVGNAWVDPGTGNENGDLCLIDFGPNLGGSGSTAWNEDIHGGHYYLQEEWSNADRGCEARAKSDSASFQAAAPAPSASWIFFRAHAHSAHGSIVGYRWFFGDGRKGSRRVTSHRYSRTGRYRVVLRTTDSWGNWAFYARTVAVGRGSGRAARATKSG